jgi:NAD-dependent deacetylase
VRCNRCNSPVATEPLPDDAPPACACGGLFRPDVVWFGEMLPAVALERAASEAAACDVFITVGTSGLVYPAAGLSAVAQRGGAFVISVNPDEAAAPVGALQLTGSASDTLPRLLAAAFP